MAFINPYGSNVEFEPKPESKQNTSKPQEATEKIEALGSALKPINVAEELKELLEIGDEYVSKWFPEPPFKRYIKKSSSKSINQ